MNLSLNHSPSMIRIADLKRGGMAALDAAILKGPAFIMKRNRSAAVVLLPADYEALLNRAARGDNPSITKLSNLDWALRNKPMPGHMDANDVGAYLRDLRSEWDDRDNRVDAYSVSQADA